MQSQTLYDQVGGYARKSSLSNTLDMEDDLLSIPDMFNQCNNMQYTAEIGVGGAPHDRNLDSMSKNSLN